MVLVRLAERADEELLGHRGAELSPLVVEHTAHSCPSAGVLAVAVTLPFAALALIDEARLIAKS